MTKIDLTFGNDSENVINYKTTITVNIMILSFLLTKRPIASYKFPIGYKKN